MSVRRSGCAVATAYSAEEFAWLQSLEWGANELEQLAWCELEPGHEGEWHYAEAQGVPEGQWWLRWQVGGTREFQLRQWCKVTDPTYPVPAPEGMELELEPCCLFEGHPGRHGFEFDTTVDGSGTGQPYLTVGELRQALASLPDDMPVRIAAVTDATLAHTEVLPVGIATQAIIARQTDQSSPVEALALIVE